MPASTVTRSSSEIHPRPVRRGLRIGIQDRLRRVPDTTRLVELTGWVPKYTLDDILREIIAEAEVELAKAASGQ